MAARKRKIVGAYEFIDFPAYGLEGVRAKIDTGAYRGALHCTIIEVKQTDDGSVLHFSPFDHPEVQVITKDYWVGYVRSSNGKRQKRYFIETKITVQGKEYPISLSLADRSEMKWPLLIGRRFLRRHSFLVDVRKGARVLLAQKEES
jgi:hypothetical protein